MVGTWNANHFFLFGLPVVNGKATGRSRWRGWEVGLQRRELRRKSEEEEEAASTVELRAESWGLHDLLFTLVVSSRLVNIWMHVWPLSLDWLQFFFNTTEALVTWGLF